MTYRITVINQTFTVAKEQTAVANTVGVDNVVFTLGDQWSDLQVFAAFRNSSDNKEYHVLLDETLTCDIPWEVLKSIGKLSIGLLGLKDSVIVRPTIWVAIANVVDGVNPEGEIAADATPTVLEQLTAIVNKSEEIAQSIRDDADSGKFDGAPGKSPKIVDGNWYVWDDETGDYVDTGVFSGGEAPYIGENGNWFVGKEDSGVSATGKDGFSPVVVTESVANGTKVSITDSTGEKEFTITNGANGEDGNDGLTPNITIGNVDTLSPEFNATATITGKTPSLTLNLGIPKGKQGETGQAATIQITETETVSPDTHAAMIEVEGSTAQNRKYKAQIPRGQQGSAGVGIPPTDTAQKGDVPTWDGENVVWTPSAGGGKGDWILIADVTPAEDIANFEFTQDAQGQTFNFTDVYLYGKAVPSAISYWIRFMNQDNVFMLAKYNLGNFKAGTDITIRMEKTSDGSITQISNGNSSAPSVMPVLTENPYDSYTTLKLYFQGNWPANTRMMIWGR